MYPSTVLLLLVLSVMLSCRPSNKRLESMADALATAYEEMDKLTTTPEIRSLKAQTYLNRGNQKDAELEFLTILEFYPKSKEAKFARQWVNKLEKGRQKEQKEWERKKRLGFMIFKEKTKVKQATVRLDFKKINLSKAWVFDRFADKCFRIPAKRESLMVTATVEATVSILNPKLPPIYVFNIQDGKLQMLRKLEYRFYRWTDWDHYRGKYHDWDNDFSYTSTITFSVGTEIPKEAFRHSPVFLMVGKFNCETPMYRLKGRPRMYMEGKSCLAAMDAMSPVEADQRFHTIRIFGKEKLVHF